MEILSSSEQEEMLSSTKKELHLLAQEILYGSSSSETSDSFDIKVQKLLREAHTVANRKPKYSYGHPYKCDQFVKHLFAAAWDTSLQEVYGAKWLYTYFAPDKHNTIVVDNKRSFLISGKQLASWDLLFFTDASGKNCGHVAVFSRQDPVTWALYVYDASLHQGIWERKIFPNELTSTYHTIYYTSPSFGV